MLVSLAALTGVITLVQGRITFHDYVRMALPLLMASSINLTVALAALILLKQSPWALIILGTLLACFIWAYRSYAQFVGQHRSLTELYELTRAMGDAGHDGTLPDVLLGRVRELLQAEYATLWLPAQGRYPEVLLTARVDSPGLLDVSRTPGCAARARGRQTASTVAVGPEARRSGDLRALRATAASRTRSWCRCGPGSAVIGTLEVAGRLGDIAALRPGRRRGCWRRWPRTPRSRWRTPAWSTGCASTPTTTR